MSRFKKIVRPFHSLGALYARFDRPISTASLFLGFALNGLFLKRADQFWEYMFIAFHLIGIALCIILIHHERRTNDAKPDTIAEHWNPGRMHFWLVNILQILLGGILSTVAVYYFRSAVLAFSWPFFLLLGAAVIGNEVLKKRYDRMSFQIGFFFLSTYLFAIYFIPVITHHIGAKTFLLSGAASIGFIVIFLTVLAKVGKPDWVRESKRVVLWVILGITALMNGLYFFDLIPPLPLVMQDAGMYHSVVRTPRGTYRVTTEPGKASFLSTIGILPETAVLHLAPNSYVYAYSAIYSPVALNTTIVHHWQQYNAESKTWDTVATIRLPITGGREGGYRTYSVSANLTEGEWRVNVETESGQLIGRLAATIIAVDTLPPLTIETLQ